MSKAEDVPGFLFDIKVGLPLGLELSGALTLLSVVLGTRRISGVQHRHQEWASNAGACPLQEGQLLKTGSSRVDV